MKLSYTVEIIREISCRQLARNVQLHLKKIHLNEHADYNPFLAIREIWNRSVFRSIN